MIALLTWADEHLPWVRGRFLMLGMRFSEIELCDALDMVHVLLEEDSGASEEQRAVKGQVRAIIYKDLYKRETSYTKAYRRSEQMRADGEGSAPISEAHTVKPYLPPTDMNSLPGILGPPLT